VRFILSSGIRFAFDPWIALFRSPSSGLLGLSWGKLNRPFDLQSGGVGRGWIQTKVVVLAST
jgi:hypothetical protein